MAIATNIVLADAATTPVNHTFEPDGLDANGFFVFSNKAPGLLAGYETIKFRVVTTGKDIRRLQIRMTVPKLVSDPSTTPPAISVANRHEYAGDHLIPPASELLDRKNLRKFVDNLYANAQVIDFIEQLILMR